jgi:DUF2075 family protein
MSHNATDKLANLIEHADNLDFTAEDIAAAKASLLDFIGVAIGRSIIYTSAYFSIHDYP